MCQVMRNVCVCVCVCECVCVCVCAWVWVCNYKRRIAGSEEARQRGLKLVVYEA